MELLGDAEERVLADQAAVEWIVDAAIWEIFKRAEWRVSRDGRALLISTGVEGIEQLNNQLAERSVGPEHVVEPLVELLTAGIEWVQMGEGEATPTPAGLGMGGAAGSGVEWGQMRGGQEIRVLSLKAIQWAMKFRCPFVPWC